MSVRTESALASNARLAKQFGAAIRSHGGGPRKWGRENAIALKRELGGLAALIGIE